MAQRIEEVFRAIAPRGRSAAQRPSPGGTDATVGGSNLSPALAEAASEIARLREVYQRQADLITANTQALQTSQGGSGKSVVSAIGSTASHALGGGLGLLSPLVSGLMSLFGRHASQPAALPVYTPPPSVGIDAVLRGSQQGTATTVPAATPAAAPQQAAYSPQITVNVSAMDSRSFMDRSTDIANAVREAMLNNHPINGVISDL